MSLQLTPAQLAEYDKNGFLLLPAVLSPAEVALLAAEAANVYSMQRPEIVRERSGAPRSAFGAHKYNAAFGVLARDPRIVGPVEQILGERCYMHQFKINAKEKFTGDLWQWHQV